MAYCEHTIAHMRNMASILVLAASASHSYSPIVRAIVRDGSRVSEYVAVIMPGYVELCGKARQ